MSDYMDPFGQADCESELTTLGEDYKKIFFGHTPFNSAALDRRTYLIVGRRGAGKTALCQYFTFQSCYHDPIVIDVDEPKEYKNALSQIAAHTSKKPDQAVSNAKEIWIYIIWCLIFQATKSRSEEIAKACVPCENLHEYSHAGFMNRSIDWLIKHFNDDPVSEDSAKAKDLMSSESFDHAISSVLNVAKKNAIFVAIDTLEKYDPSDTDLMNAIAGLVECAAEFNLKYSVSGVHVKAFISGEIYPHLLEVSLQNPLKNVKHPVFMLWRAKDLLRLIAWRFYKYLKKNDLLMDESRGAIDWDKPRDVLEKAWEPYFGKQVVNRRGIVEHSFAYVLRHTQMRPRQLIELCNSISKKQLNPEISPGCQSQILLWG